jgi:hypothetical protein
MRAQSFEGIISNGRLPRPVSQEIAGILRKLEGKKAAITIAQARKRRSLNQNAYWFGMLNKYAVPVFRDYGDNWDEFSVHEYVMGELGYVETLVKPGGALFKVRKSSRNFSTKEWEEFMERARAFLLVEHGISLPFPNER